MKNQLTSCSVPNTDFSTGEALELINLNTDENFLLISKDLKIIYSNSVACTGISSRLGQTVTLGMNVLELVDEARRNHLVHLYSDVFNGNERRSEIAFTNADRSTNHLEVYFKPARDKNNNIVACLVCTRDITEKKKAEKALREAEERWRFALEGAGQGVWDLNISTGDIFYSEGYLKMYGFEESDYGSSLLQWEQRVHPADLEGVKELMQTHLHNNSSTAEYTYRIKNKKGDYRWILSRSKFIEHVDGKPRRAIGVHIDITEMVNAELELKRTNEEIKVTNERFNVMMKATHDMIWDWDIENDHFYRGEEGLLNVFGVQQNESISTIEQWIKRVHPQDAPAVKSLIQNLLESATGDTFHCEYRFLKDDGTYSYVYDRGMILRNAVGKPVRIIGAAQDISDRKKLQMEILNKELEYQKQINQASIDSQEKERSEIGKELHDNINQVLTTTKLYLDLALTTADTKDQLIKKSTENIVKAIGEIRQLSRSLMDPTINDLGLSDSINDLIENINFTKKIRIKYNIDSSVDDKLSNQQKLAAFRILQESLNNIIKHAKAKEVAIRFRDKGCSASLTIKDDGIGFDPKNIKRGAGLNNIQNRVYLINGTYSITSEPNQGCKLVINFPINLNAN
jgi:PAS domain S-box-containing protein